MTSIYGYSATAASNSASPPDGAPENMAPSGVNDTMRKMMANLAEFAIAPTAGGTADALTVTPTNAVAALVDGMVMFVRAASANATTTPTFAPSGLPAHTITKQGGTALVAGDIAGAGHVLILQYKASGTTWDLLNPKVNAGTVTSVAASVPSFLSLAGSPITSTGTLAITLANQNANIVFAGPSSGAAAAPTFRSLVKADLPAGTYINTGYAETATYTTINGSTGTNAIPYDDTVPQNSEGVELVTVTVTPRDANSVYEIDYIVPFSLATGSQATAAIFQDTTADAIDVQTAAGPGTGANDLIAGKFRIAAGSSSARTYKLRAGPSGSVILHVNGQVTAGARRFGGVLKAVLMVREVAQ